MAARDWVVTDLAHPADGFLRLEHCRYCLLLADEAVVYARAAGTREYTVSQQIGEADEHSVTVMRTYAHVFREEFLREGEG